MANDQITSELNTLLADYSIFYQKLRNYHWNVKGQEFFKLHEKFEEAYNQTADWVDDIAERILALDGSPYATLEAFTDHARLDEDGGTPHEADQMVQNVVNDIETLNEHTLELIHLTEENRDRTTTNLLDDIVDAQEQRAWMFRSFLKNNS